MSKSAPHHVQATTTHAPDLHYSLIIQWDPRDAIYIVTVPEVGSRTHGKTYEEALAQAQDLIESFIGTAEANGESLPAAQIFTPLP